MFVARASRFNLPPVLQVQNLNLWYDDKQALIDVSFDLYPSEILAFIGPSGCGKSTALKCLNRMHDDTRGVRFDGTIEMDGHDIHDPDTDPPLHRRRFGWVAQKPNPFAMSIWRNVAYFHLGRLLELGPTDQIFNMARTDEARRFIAGKFG